MLRDTKEYSQFLFQEPGKTAQLFIQQMDHLMLRQLLCLSNDIVLKLSFGDESPP